MTNPSPHPGAPDRDQHHAPWGHYASHPYPGQPYLGQPYPGPRPYPGQPYGGQPYPGLQPYPGQPYGYPPLGVAPHDPTGAVGTRVGQYLVDALLVAVPVIVLVVGFASLAPVATPDSGVLPLVITLVLFLLGMAAGWLVFVWWPSTHGGQTPAMGWLNLRIVTEQGGPPSLGALSVRWLLLAVDGQAFGLVGLVVMLTTARHQRLGDMAAQTLVVRAD